MKHKLLKLLLLVEVVVLGITLSQQVKAEEAYDITKVSAVAQIKSDGSLVMERQITYDFNDDAHGVYYQQNLNKHQKIKNLHIKVQDNDGGTQAAKHYSVKRTTAGYRFKVYHAVSEDDQLTVTYDYRITNAIINYQDTAELNFMIIGNNWDTDLDHVKASVIFPKAVKQLKAWAHGPLNGELRVLPQQGKIVMKVDNLDGNTGIEVHTIFPLTVTPFNKNIVKQNHRQVVLKQEAKLASEANQKRRRNQVIDVILTALGLISGLVAIVKGFSVKKQGISPKKISALAHNYEIPAASPVGAQILDSGHKPDSHAFTAYLMQLVGQKKLTIKDCQVRRKTYYRLTIVDNAILANDELLQFLFTQVGDGQSFTTKDLRHYHGKKLGAKFDDWAKAEYQQVEKQGYISRNLRKKYNFTRNLILILLVIGFILEFLANVVYQQFSLQLIIGEIIVTLLGIAAYLWVGRRIAIYTSLGAQEVEKVRGFKKMLTDIGNFKMRNVGDIILWEDIMPYAVAFDLAVKVAKELQIEFSQEELANDNYLWFYVGDHDSFVTSFNSSFTSSISIGSSSAGSSGGFGGGSGGGAF